MGERRGREDYIIGPPLFHAADYPGRTLSRQYWRNRIGSLRNKYNLCFRDGNGCFQQGSKMIGEIFFESLNATHALVYSFVVHHDVVLIIIGLSVKMVVGEPPC